MVSQTVTILIQSVIILLALVLAGWGWWRAAVFESGKQDYIRAVDALAESQKRDRAEIEELTEINRRLRKALQSVPLQEKPRRVDTPIKQARTSGDVRRLTEQAFGGKPDASGQ